MSSRMIGILLTLVLGATMVLAPVAQGKSEWREEFGIRPGQKIIVEMDQGGSLEVVGTGRDEVRIICSASQYVEDWDIEVKETSYGLFMTVEPPRKNRSNNFTVNLEVPREFNIETSSGGGHIFISNVTGTFEGRTAGGAITLKNLTGEAHLTTGGGFIRIEDSDLNGKVSSGGGGGLMKNVVGSLDAYASGGVFSYENVQDRDGDIRVPEELAPSKARAGTVVKYTPGGEMKVTEAPEGAIVSTGGGNILIRNASEFVHASTGGGDIEIEIEDGPVSARTGGGDVKIIVLEGLGDDGEDVSINTGWGDVTLVLPEDASVEFDLDLAYTRKSRRDFEIISDFDLDLEHTTRWESRDGSPRKHIFGTATINGGKHKVVINGVNGDIRIEKR